MFKIQFHFVKRYDFVQLLVKKKKRKKSFLMFPSKTYFDKYMYGKTVKC